MMRSIIIAALVLFCASACVDIDEYGSVMKGGTVVSLRFDGGLDVCTRSSLGDVESVFSGGCVAVYDHDSGKLNFEQPVESLYGEMEMKIPSGRTLDYFFVGNMDFVFPKNEEELRTMQYRIGRFADVAERGIPLVGENTGVRGVPEVTIDIRRLFSKISLTIDHSGLDGGGDESFFRNSKLYVRQANAMLAPFGEHSAAMSENDLLTESDYDPQMQNGRSSTFVYYAPENFGGSHPSYVEFTGVVDPAAGGYGGTVCYRFVLGGEKGLEANKHYHIRLGFNAGSLFEPSWSVEPGDDWTDGRRFALSADPEGRNVLPQGRTIAVRPSRAGVCYLYFDKGRGVNCASELSLCSGDFSPADLTDAAWSWDAPGLAEHGLTLDVTGGILAFRVSDPSRFVPGEEVPVTLHLYPGDLRYEALVRTYEDIRVEIDGGLSLDDEFYVGMKRGIRVSGLAGSTLYYRNGGFEEDSGITASPAENAPSIGGSRNSMPAGDKLELYARSYVAGSDFVLELSSDDPFNDGDIVLETRVEVHKSRVAHNGYGAWYLGIDGSEKDVNYGYLDESGELIDRSRFDPALYSMLLEPVAGYGTASGTEISEWVGHRDGKVWLKALKSSSGVDVGDAVDQDNYFLGMINLGPKDPDAASGSTGAFLFVHYPEFMGSLPTRVETDYFNVAASSGIHTSWMANFWGCTTFEPLFDAREAPYISLDAELAENGFHRINWNFDDPPGGIGDHVPCGHLKTTIRFRNKHSGEIYDLEVSFDVVHNVELGVYMIFQKDYPTVQKILVTSAKVFYGMKRFLTVNGIPDMEPLSDIAGTWCNYLKITMQKTLSQNYQVEKEVYGRNCVADYEYSDFRPSAYGRGEVRSEANINEFLRYGTSPFTEVRFVTSSPAQYSGNPYVNISVVNKVRGHYVIAWE